MSEFEESDMISDAEKLQIAQHFLLSSPPGQFAEVLSDVKKLVGPVLSDDAIAQTARSFNNKTLRVVTAPSGQKTVINPINEVDATHSRDNNNTAFAVDHTTLATAEDDSGIENGEGSLELSRASLQTAISNYVANKFTCELAAGTVAAKDNKLHIYICTEKPNLRNFWSGKWTSTWVVTVDGDSASVSGEIKIHAHYFEDGNVQMVTNKPIAPKAITFTSESELASGVVTYIKDSESALQLGMEDMYSNMSEETIKSLRRTMPITRSKMDWNLNAVRMTRQIRK